MSRETATWLIRAAVTSASAAFLVLLVGLVVAPLVRTRPAVRHLVRGWRWPLTIGMATAALRVSLESAPFEHGGWKVALQATTIALVIECTWVVMRSVTVVESALSGRFDIDADDNRRARSLRTQIHLLSRVASVLVVVLGVIGGLMVVPWGRQLGASFLAAGGIIGIVFGVSGRSTIGNVVAGLQVAFTEPIRLEDVVVVEGEWGNIEEITLTYVVVRVWDERRLVLPTTYFVERPFENWTRRHAAISGTVELWVDYSAPLAEMRAELQRLVDDSPEWDGRSADLKVTDTSPHAMKVRVVVTAADSGQLWNLRCNLRESLLVWLAEQRPSGLPRLRVQDDEDGTATP